LFDAIAVFLEGLARGFVDDMGEVANVALGLEGLQVQRVETNATC
jgi:hypothetical protein